MGDFKARAGALTLLFMASAQERADLLRILADAMVEEKDRLLDLDTLPDPDSYSDEYYELDDEDEEDLEEEYEDEDDVETGDFDPDTPYVLAGAGARGEPSFEIDPDAPLEATPAGLEALVVATALEEWMQRCPGGSLEIGETDAGFALAALVCGWAAGIVHVLAREPLALPEVNAAVPPIPYRVIEEHVDSMESIALVETVTGADGRKRHAATNWLREGIVPLAVATRFESHHPADDVAPPERIDVEAAFCLALPLLELPPGLSGSCRLSAELVDGSPAGVTVRLEDGWLASCTTDLEREVDAWATASVVDWLDTLIEPTVAGVEMGGDEDLAASLLAGLHERLFALPVS